VQLAAELLAGVFLDLDDPLFLFQQVLVQRGVLQGDGRLAGDGHQQLDMLLAEGIGHAAAKEQHAVVVKAGAQRHAEDAACILEGDEVAQFRVAPGVTGENRLRLLEGQAQHALPARNLFFQVGVGQATGIGHLELAGVLVIEQHGADQAGVGADLMQAQHAHVQGGIEHGLVIERGAERGGHLVDGAGLLPRGAQPRRFLLAGLEDGLMPDPAQGGGADRQADVSGDQQ